MEFDVNQLLLARLWIARIGERDVHKWWASDAVLGDEGAFVGPRLLPKTHATGRARIAFAVARHACDERHPDPDVFHLFRLDPATEDRFDQLLVDRLADFDWWDTVISELERVDNGVSTAEVLLRACIVHPSDVEAAENAELGPAGRSLKLRSGDTPDDTVRRLAAGFARSQPGELAVPCVKGLST